MDRVTEFNNIMPIKNIASVLQHGILSFQKAAKLEHNDISMKEVQDIRDGITLPNSRPLHKCANVYFDARNPMMYKRRRDYEDICILRISKKILSIPNTFVSTQNASSKYTQFYNANDVTGDCLDLDKIYARDWEHEEQIDKWRHASIKCAEVLVPRIIPSKYILGAYVASEKVKKKLIKCGFNLDVMINSDKFFR